MIPLDCTAKNNHGLTRLPETGASQRILVSLADDRAEVSLDTSGEGLHRRGYRTQAGETPLRETLAAALVQLSRWGPDRPFADVTCGSGTIAIEAALAGRNLAPGINRRFAAEAWVPAAVWERARDDARMAAREVELQIHGSDRDPGVIRIARENARRAGVEEDVHLATLPAAAYRPTADYGCMVCNPPYGHRLAASGSEAGATGADLAATFGRLMDSYKSWSYFFLSGSPGFERLVGRRSSRNRKLYNGDLKCYLYQYYGPVPRREEAAT